MPAPLWGGGFDGLRAAALSGGLYRTPPPPPPPAPAEEERITRPRAAGRLWRRGLAVGALMRTAEMRTAEKWIARAARAA